MRILGNKQKIVIAALDVGGLGGMELHLEKLIMQLKEDVDVTVVASRMNLPNDHGVRFIRIPVPRKPAPLRMIMFAILATIRIFFIKRDILHTTGAIVFNHTDLATVHFCHAGYVRETGNTRVRKNPSVLRRLNSTIASKIALTMERILYNPKRITKLVAVSKRVRSELLEFFPYSLENIEVIPNGVDIHRFHPYMEEEKHQLRKKYSFPEKGDFLLFMGGDWPLKGLDIVLHAFNQIANDFSDVYLIVVGKGEPKQYISILSKEAVNRVYFVGIQPNPHEWFGLSNVFLCLSSYETFSLVVHEAAATGLLVLTTKVGGVEDLIRNNVEGIIVQRDSKQLEQRLREILPNLVNYKILGENARNNVEKLTWEHTYELTKFVYNASFVQNKMSIGRTIQKG